MLLDIVTRATPPRTLRTTQGSHRRRRPLRLDRVAPPATILSFRTSWSKFTAVYATSRSAVCTIVRLRATFVATRLPTPGTSAGTKSTCTSWTQNTRRWPSIDDLLRGLRREPRGQFPKRGRTMICLWRPWSIEVGAILWRRIGMGVGRSCTGSFVWTVTIRTPEGTA